MNPTLNAKFSPRAKAAVEDFLSRIDGYEPVLCLMKGRDSRETSEHWNYGAYAPQQIEQWNQLQLGHPLCYEVSGLLVAIPQFQFIGELRGKTIDLGEKHLELLDSNIGV